MHEGIMYSKPFVYQKAFSLEGSSPEFEDLIKRLVDKNPATRIKWPVRSVMLIYVKELSLCIFVQELIVHPFWQVRLSPVPMPPEPMLEAFISKYHLAPTGEDQFASLSNSSVRLISLKCWPHSEDTQHETYSLYQLPTNLHTGG